MCSIIFPFYCLQNMACVLLTTTVSFLLLQAGSSLLCPFSTVCCLDLLCAKLLRMCRKFSPRSPLFLHLLCSVCSPAKGAAICSPVALLIDSNSVVYSPPLRCLMSQYSTMYCPSLFFYVVLSLLCGFTLSYPLCSFLAHPWSFLCVYVCVLIISFLPLTNASSESLRPPALSTLPWSRFFVDALYPVSLLFSTEEDEVRVGEISTEVRLDILLFSLFSNISFWCSCL